MGMLDGLSNSSVASGQKRKGIALLRIGKWFEDDGLFVPELEGKGGTIGVPSLGKNRRSILSV